MNTPVVEGARLLARVTFKQRSGDNVDSNERHGQVARNTLIASVVIEAVTVSANNSFVVVDVTLEN